MINVTETDAERLSKGINMPVEKIKGNYLETGISGDMVVNKMPCYFLSDNKCTVYEHRFSECREFPHLHKPGFTRRLFSTLINYGICPIVFNVIEKLKTQVGFIP
jgi:Fe-S-cluster containining protein